MTRRARPTATTPLPAVLIRAAEELRGCAARLARVEEAVAGLLAAGDPAISSAGAPARGLQEIDPLMQTVDDLARSLGGVARSLPPGARVETRALAPMRLRDLRARLLRRGPAERPPRGSAPRGPGPVDLF